MNKLIFVFLMLFTLNVNAQITGNDIIDPLFSDNPICIYLKDFSNTMQVFIYNNYEDSIVYVNEVYLMNNDNILDKKSINNNQNINEVKFDIDEDQIYDIIVTTNRDNWKITFDKYTKYRWRNMEKCIFTRIKETRYKKSNSFRKNIYSIDGRLLNNTNSKIYIYNGKKYVR
jgi:hypothetical protein